MQQPDNSNKSVPCPAQVQHDLGLPEYRSPEEAEAHAAELVDVYK